MKNLEKASSKRKATSSLKVTEEVKAYLDELKLRLNKERNGFWSHSDVIESLIKYYLSHEEN